MSLRLKPLVQTHIRPYVGLLCGVLFWALALFAPGAVLRIDSDPAQVVTGLHVGFLALGLAGGVWMFLKIFRGQASRLDLAGLGFWLLVPAGLSAELLWPGACGLFWILGGAGMLATRVPLGESRAVPSFRFSECGRVAGLFTLVFTLTGFWHTTTVGEHTGDEGHYLVQAQSLQEDGDLDIRNQLPGATNRDKINFHISPNARENAWYSWHTPGLSFLLAPTLGYSLWVRHLLLGSIAGVGIGGLYACCRSAALSRTLSLSASLLTGLSVFYGVYASRALPEVAGAALLNLGFFAALVLRRAPVRTAILSALCVGCLPWMQSRFVPPSLVLMGIYGLEGLLRPVPFSQRLKHLAPYSLGCLLLLAGYLGFKHQLFEAGSAYPVSDLLFSELKGLWHTLGSQRGIVTSFPLFLAGLAALPMMGFKKESRKWAGYVLLLFLSVWLTSCATKWFTGGSTLPGRFLLVISGPVIWLLACSWQQEGCHPLRVRVHLFLGMIPVLLFCMQLVFLPQLGEAFNSSFQVTAVHPGMSRVPMFHYEPYGSFVAGGAACLLLILLLLEFPQTRKVWLFLPSALLCLIVYLQGAEMVQSDPQERIRITARILEVFPAKPHFWFAHGNREQSTAFLDVANRYIKGVPGGLKNMTQQDLGVVDNREWISTPHLPQNDPLGRPYHWGTLIGPYRPPERPLLLRLTGNVPGESDVELVLREGASVHGAFLLPAGQPFDVSFDAHMQDRGDLYLLARFLGENGILTTKTLQVSSYEPGLLKAGGWEKPVGEN